MRELPIALTIAGSDSGGGAGIQADLKTFHAFGVFGTTAITAITAQNTRGVRSVQRVDPRIVVDQIHAVAADLPPNAAKSGMLADAVIIRAVAGALRDTGIERYVLDPVMVAKSGDRLLEETAVDALREHLLPLAEIVTPNLPEAAILVDRPVQTPDDMREAAKRLVSLGARSALVKGGHLAGPEIIDVLLDGTEWFEWRRPRLDTPHTHGTGCTLSAGICAGLAHGWPRSRAVERAGEFTHRAVETAPGLGAGHGPLNHWIDVDLT